MRPLGLLLVAAALAVPIPWFQPLLASMIQSRC
jgi:hypothetical protein